VLAVVAGVSVCSYLHFDALSIIVLADRTHWFGEVITGAVIAGGSKGSIKLFRDWLGFAASAYGEREDLRREYRERRERDASPEGAVAGSSKGNPRRRATTGSKKSK
jgi:hypothetical protein